LEGFTAASAATALRTPLKALIGVTFALYALNQMSVLPRISKPLSAFVSKALFYPTLPITISRRIGAWSTVIDDTVVIGGAPFGFWGIPEKLHDFGVRGIVNLCEEYQGPVQKYKALGMRQLWLPTVDHTVPTVASLEQAVDFIKEYERQGKRVYVHCRAGHGRSAAAVFCWMLQKDPNVDLKQLNEEFGKVRKVKSTLWNQPNILEYHSKLLDENEEL
jgi:atypical dual specificity phosphatase